jgi:hypothetical protein
MEFAEISIGDPSEEPNRTPFLLGPAFESAAVTAGTGDDHLQLRMRGSQSGGRVDEHVKPFSRNKTTQPEDDLVARSNSKAGADLSPALIGDWNEALRVDSGRHDHDGERLPGGPLSFSGGIPPGGDDNARVAQHPGQHRPSDRKTARNSDLGAMKDHSIGAIKTRTELAKRKRRIKKNNVGVDLCSQRIYSTHQSTRGQQHPSPIAFDPDGLSRIECSVAGARCGEHSG